MTDEERYPPPYEAEALAEFRRTQLPARERLRAQQPRAAPPLRGRDRLSPRAGRLAVHRPVPVAARCHRHRRAGQGGHRPRHALARPRHRAHAWGTGSAPPATARTTGASGTSRTPTSWCPAPTRACGSTTPTGVVDPTAVDAYRRADRLDQFGFSGWIGREPHGADKADTGFVRDGVFADQVVDLFAELAASDDDAPWLAVASFVNPHDIGVQRLRVERARVPTDPGRRSPTSPRRRRSPTRSRTVPTANASSATCGRSCSTRRTPTSTYRRLYHFLHMLVDAAIMRILDELHARRPRRRHHHRVHVRPRRPARCARRAAAEVAQRVRRGHPCAAARVRARTSTPTAGGVEIATSHVDLVPTLLGLAGVDVEAAARDGGPSPRRDAAAARARPERAAHRHRDRGARSTHRSTS